MTESKCQSSQPNPTTASIGQPRKRWFWPWFWRIFLVVSLSYAWYSFYVPKNHIAWADDFASAQKQAEKSDQPMILFFTGEWCVPCRIMKRTVWADAEVEEVVNGTFTPVAIYREDPNADQTFTRYEISATPTTVITDAQGNVLEKIYGRITKPDFLELLKRNS